MSSQNPHERREQHMSDAVAQFTDVVQAAAQNAAPCGTALPGRPVGTRSAAETERAAPQTVYDLTPDDLQRLASTAECKCGGSGRIKFTLPADHPAHGRLFWCACQAADNAHRRLASLFGTGIPPRYQRLTFDTFALLPDEMQTGKEAALSVAQQFAGCVCASRRGVDHYRQQRGLVLDGVTKAGLLLFGPVGRGKTGLAAAVCRAWANAGEAPLWITWSALIASIWREYGRDGDGARARIEEAQRVSLLVLDEFGDVTLDGPAHPDQRRIAYEIVNYRHDYFLPTLVTTNLNPLRAEEQGGSEIRRQFGAPIHDRLVEDLCHSVPVGGANLRHAFIDLGGPK